MSLPHDQYLQTSKITVLQIPSVLSQPELILYRSWYTFTPLLLRAYTHVQFLLGSPNLQPTALLLREHSTYSPVQPPVTPPPWLPGRQAMVWSYLVRGHCCSHRLPVATVGCTPALPVAVLEVWRWRYTWTFSVSIRLVPNFHYILLNLHINF